MAINIKKINIPATSRSGRIYSTSSKSVSYSSTTTGTDSGDYVTTTDFNNYTGHTATNMVTTLLSVGSIAITPVIVTGITYNIANIDAMIIQVSTGVTTINLPTPSYIGETHIVMNASETYTQTINRTGTTPIWSKGVSYTTRSNGVRQSFTFVYNGYAWVTITY